MIKLIKKLFKKNNSKNKIDKALDNLDKAPFGGIDLDDKKITVTVQPDDTLKIVLTPDTSNASADKKPAAKKPGRPKGQGNSSSKTPTAKKQVSTKSTIQNKNK